MERSYRWRHGRELYAIAFVVVSLNAGLISALKSSGSCTPVVQDGKEAERTLKYRTDETCSFGKPGKESHRVQKKHCEIDHRPPSQQPRDCAEIQACGRSESGIYVISPDGTGYPFNVYCYLETNGGGWTVFQRRIDGSVDFKRDWSAYKHGFGSLSSEHWLGNDKLHRLSNHKAYKLRVDLQSFDRGHRYATHSRFHVGNETDKYKLTVDGYSGSAHNVLGFHSGNQFSTRDMVDDKSDLAYAEVYGSGWWFGRKMKCNLNGIYYNETMLANSGAGFPDGIVWTTFTGFWSSLKGSKMTIRPLN